MNWLLATLSAALQGSPVLALGAAAVLGLASVLLSPCHLASVPLVVAVVQARDPTRRGAVGIALRFGLGVVASFAVVGSVTVALGRIAGDLGVFGAWAGAAILILFGLHTLEVIELPWMPRGTSHDAVRNAHPGLIGFVFGSTLGPCTFAFMAPALGAAFALAPTRPALAVGVLLSFSLAHAALLTAAGIFGEATVQFLSARGAIRAVGLLRQATGVLLVVAGLVVIAWGR